MLLMSNSPMVSDVTPDLSFFDRFATRSARIVSQARFSLAACYW
jgi:hypothetical protein